MKKFTVELTDAEFTELTDTLQRIGVLGIRLHCQGLTQPNSELITSAFVKICEASWAAESAAATYTAAANAAAGAGGGP